MNIVKRVIRKLGRVLFGNQPSAKELAAQKAAYRIDDARNYWRYPPNKTDGKRDTEYYCTAPDDVVRALVEREISERDAKQDAAVYKRKVADLVKAHGVKSMLDFGCGLGQDGLHFAKELGVSVTFADIVPSNVRLTSRYAGIWGLPTESVLLESPETADLPRTFDLMFSSGVLHHSPHAKAIVANLRRFLKPGGLFVVMLYTYEHFLACGAEGLGDYANKSEAPAPVPVENPYTEYYDVKRTCELFAGFELVEHWTTHHQRFGWCCFRNGA